MIHDDAETGARLVARTEHASCSKREPIHSHSHSHSSKPLNPPGQGEVDAGALTLPAAMAGRGRAKELPALEVLCEWFAYDPEQGRLIWRKRAGNKATAGVVAGNKQANGYRSIEFKGRHYREHRLIWAICTGAQTVGDLDHINGIRDDNRIENLRDVGRFGNAQNERAARKSNRSTGLLGVYKVGQRYRAIITAHRERVDLGRFATPEEAHAAYVTAKRRLHEGCTI